MKKKVKYIASAAVIGCLLAGTAALSIHSAAFAAEQVKDEDVIGGGAPAKVIQDNDSIRVTLVSYPKGFSKEGHLRRKNEQLLVYVDDGAFKINRPPASTPQRPAAPGAKNPESPVGPDGSVVKSDNLPKGTIAWHPKGSFTPPITTLKAYRILFIEFKR